MRRRLVVSFAIATTACGGSTQPDLPVAARLAFTVQPTRTTIEQTIAPAIRVTIQDSAGATVASSTAVVISLGANPGGATLDGELTANAVEGVAEFSTLAIHRPGDGYTLVASSGSLTSATSTPFDVVLDLAAVSSGNRHTCGVTDGGAAYCWGDNGGGRLGDGTTTSRLTPAAVVGGLTFAEVGASSGDHTCGLTTDSVAYCWGSNGSGQLGAGPIGNQDTPTKVSGTLTFSRLSVGAFHNCALTADGTAYCWGSNGTGQLGNSTAGAIGDTPTPVSGSLTFVAVSAGGAHTCGLAAGGTAYCWGLNAYGQVGDGTVTNRTAPVLVSGGLSFVAIAAGFTHTCGLTAGGTAYCWGSNRYGELGDGTTVAKSVPTQVSGALTFTALSTGDYTCGLTSSGGAYCWGFDQQGQLGNGSTTDSSVPVPVSGGLTFSTLSVSVGHACGLTLDGSGYCWGNNFYGQLGTGTTTNSDVPMLISGS